MLPLGEFCGQATLNREALTPLLRIFPGLAEELISGNFDFCAPAARFHEIATWSGSGRLTVTDLHSGDITVQRIETRLTLRNSRLAAPPLNAVIYEAAVSGNATLELDAPFATQAQLELRTFRPGLLLESLSPAAVGLVTSGQFAGTANVTATLQPFKFTGNGVVNGADMQVKGLNVEALSAVYVLKPDRGQLSNLQSRIWGGTVIGELAYPFDEMSAGQWTLRLGGLNLAQVPAEFLPVPAIGQVDVDVNCTIPAGAVENLLQWEGTAMLASHRLESEGLAIEQVRGHVQLQQEVLHVNELTAIFGGGQLTGVTVIPLGGEPQPTV